MYVYKPNFSFLEMAHTNFFSPIRQTACQPLVYTTFYKFQPLTLQLQNGSVFNTSDTFIYFHILGELSGGSKDPSIGHITKADATAGRKLNAAAVSKLEAELAYEWTTATNAYPEEPLGSPVAKRQRPGEQNYISIHINIFQYVSTYFFCFQYSSIILEILQFSR